MQVGKGTMLLDLMRVINLDSINVLLLNSQLILKTILKIIYLVIKLYFFLERNMLCSAKRKHRLFISGAKVISHNTGAMLFSAAVKMQNSSIIRLQQFWKR